MEVRPIDILDKTSESNINKKALLEYNKKTIYKENHQSWKSSKIANANANANDDNIYLHYLEIKSNLKFMRLHLKNLLLNSKYKIIMYENIHELQSIKFQDFIICCGGFDKTIYLDNCAFYNLKTKMVNFSYKLNQARSYLSIVCSKEKIYAIGGHNGVDLASCEVFDFNQSKWKIIPSLGKPNQSITSIFIEPNLLYSFGGFKSRIERLNISSSKYKWEKIRFPNKIQRKWGGAIRISSKEILLFGGSESVLFFQLYNLDLNKLEIKKKFFPNYSFSQSKPIYYQGNYMIISPFQKCFFQINPASLQANQFELNF